MWPLRVSAARRAADGRAAAPARPELLLDHEFERLPDALAKLQAAFPNSDVGSMVAAQPLLLVEDIALVIDELRRCARAVCACVAAAARRRARDRPRAGAGRAGSCLATRTPCQSWSRTPSSCPCSPCA